MTHTKSLLPALFAAGLLLGASHMASAQAVHDSGMSSSSMHAAGSSYIGLSGGPSDFSRINAGNGLYSSANRDTAYNLSLGNYFPNQNVGVELGYTNFGTVARGGGSAKAEGINLSVIGRLPVSTMFNLLGKVGTTYGHTDVSANPLSGLASGSESGFDWSYGVGAELVFNPQWSGVLQYDEHYLKFAGNSSERVTTTTIGARMRF